ncbi:phosphoribosyltransferase [Pengzhenrongella frigida]|uniref:Phosphoribosyltransferase n=1 Tax=Pengzhenrongella frigida TaxID=1259133 RepID=A0A4Q5MZ01_9MICO|nr:phosphoribosyltransferase [Cellulomonas sp. HLT2-17]RYV50930.1 phosphoribosyltransferase [Cellulomonas sp. HLT2-17]
MAVFADRVEAGRQLAGRLTHLRGRDVVVLGLPRGGVPVAAEVARTLEAPLDVIVVRKLGLPFQPELAMGAIGEGGVRFVDADLVARARVTADELDGVERRERAALEVRVARLRRGRERIDLTGRIALIVDDGMATGSTARVACEVARGLGASRVVLAVPVAPADVVDNLTEPDEIVCDRMPTPFVAVGRHYRDFSPTSDEDVIAALDEAARRVHGRVVDPPPVTGRDVEIPIEAGLLAGRLDRPEQAAGVVVFAHGSGSSRHSPRNRFVASVLHRAGLGTLLLDLLTPREELDRANVFDIPLLAHRLGEATQWLRDRPEAAGARIGYFGASTGAGAALWAAADQGAQISAVVSRGGRPDLAAPRLAEVRAPTLLIVGGADTTVLELNRRAQTRLTCPNQLDIVRGATHLFEEPGTLAEVALLASGWFNRYLRASGDSADPGGPAEPGDPADPVGPGAAPSAAS